MRRWAGLLPALGLLAAATMTGDAEAQQQGQQRQGPPHEWAMGVWTGGAFPAADTDAQACYANATVIVLRDVVMRASVLDVAWRQRLVETVAATEGGGLLFRFAPHPPLGGPFGGRVPPDAGFGCDGGNPNLLRIERRGENEIAFPNCAEFPSPLKRCGAGR